MPENSHQWPHNAASGSLCTAYKSTPWWKSFPPHVKGLRATDLFFSWDNALLYKNQTHTLTLPLLAQGVALSRVAKLTDNTILFSSFCSQQVKCDNYSPCTGSEHMGTISVFNSFSSFVKHWPSSSCSTTEELTQEIPWPEAQPQFTFPSQNIQLVSHELLWQ